VPREAGSAPRPSAGLLETLAAAAAWYQQQLRQSPEAIAYLKRRGLSGEVTAQFGIGYAPPAWDGLIRQMGADEGQLDRLQRAGMLSQGKSGTYDKFRDRIMFPIHDRRGRIIAFGGRALGDDGPKYLNSPETELFHKGRELYGLFQARKSQPQLERILVVEGYMDVLALVQFGFHNCVATLGTATTGEHAELLFRAADEVVYCFDGDRAGRKAAWRALEATLPRLRDGRQARFLFLPEGEDPDSMVRRHGAQAFGDLLAQAQPLSAYFFAQLTEAVDMNSIDGRARLVGLAKPHLDQIPAGVFRDMMVERLETLARHRLEEAPRRRPAPAARPAAGASPALQRTAMRLALAHIVQSPSLAGLVRGMEAFAGCDLPGFEIYRELVDFCAKSPNMTTAQLLELWRDHPAQSHLQKLATWQLPEDGDRAEQEFRDAVTGLELQWIKQRISRMEANYADLPAEERQKLLALQHRAQELIGALQGAERGR
jgi:DNA primase